MKHLKHFTTKKHEHFIQAKCRFSRNFKRLGHIPPGYRSEQTYICTSNKFKIKL